PQSGAFSTISSLCSHTASTVIYTLSLHDALPIWEDGLEVVRQRADGRRHRQRDEQLGRPPHVAKPGPDLALGPRRDRPGPQLLRSEEHTSELQSRENLVCRLLLEKKKKQHIRRCA